MRESSKTWPPKADVLRTEVMVHFLQAATQCTPDARCDVNVMQEPVQHHILR
jgi:hypothetical protein